MREVPATRITFEHLSSFIGQSVTVTIDDGPRVVENGIRRSSGKVVSVFQCDHGAPNRDASKGFVVFDSGQKSSWSRYDVITITNR